jgi:hypothetical protein
MFAKEEAVLYNKVRNCRRCHSYDDDDDDDDVDNNNNNNNNRSISAVGVTGVVLPTSVVIDPNPLVCIKLEVMKWQIMQ